MPSGARVRRSTNQTMVAGTWTPIQFNTVEFDTSGFWSPTNPERLTCKSPGWYQIVGNVQAVSAGARIGIFRNGIQIADAQSGIANQYLVIAAGYLLNLNDVITLQYLFSSVDIISGGSLVPHLAIITFP